MSDPLEQFFPPCTNPNCERKGAHSDILPYQREILESTEKFLAVLGGYGAGKTLPVCILGVLLSLQVPGNVGLVARRSYSKLHDSTQRIFLEVLDRIGAGYHAREVRDGWPHRIILDDNQSEVHFRETKDLGRFLGPEYGWFLVDEAAEEPKKTFIDLVGRLRLPQARKYLRGIIASNPPHHQHWIADVFGTQPGRRLDGRTSYRLFRVSSRINPYLPSSYVADLESNNPASEVRRIIDGEYGFVFAGKAVYQPPFSFNTHVREIAPVPMSIVRSWDFGYHAPAVTWHQFPRCRFGTVHWLVVHEYPGKDLEAETLAGIVKEQTRSKFPDMKPDKIVDCGDAAGAQVSDKGPGPIIRLQRKPFEIKFRYKHLPNIDPGVSLIRNALMATCKCNQPVFQIDRTCRHTIDGLAGGYHYPQFKDGRNQTDSILKPMKDGFYDNIMDSVRYAGENWYRQLLRDPKHLDQLMATQEPGSKFPEPEERWAWMERKLATA